MFNESDVIRDRRGQFARWVGAISQGQRATLGTGHAVIRTRAGVSVRHGGKAVASGLSDEGAARVLERATRRGGQRLPLQHAPERIRVAAEKAARTAAEDSAEHYGRVPDYEGSAHTLPDGSHHVRVGFGDDTLAFRIPKGSRTFRMNDGTPDDDAEFDLLAQELRIPVERSLPTMNEPVAANMGGVLADADAARRVENTIPQTDAAWREQNVRTRRPRPDSSHNDIARTMAADGKSHDEIVAALVAADVPRRQARRAARKAHEGLES